MMCIPIVMITPVIPEAIDGYDAEGQLTSAIQYVTMDSTELPVIYQVSGHGETALAGGFTEAIEKAISHYLTLHY